MLPQSLHQGNIESGIIGSLKEIPMGALKLSNFAVRQSAEEVAELAHSIAEKGLLEPILVRPTGTQFEVVAGWRRFNACKQLGWRSIMCRIVELDDRSAFEVSLVENIQRKNMYPLEEAEAFRKYVEDYGWGSITELSKKMGKSISYVSKRISLLDLPDDVIQSMRQGQISPSIAEELSRINDNEEQSELARLISARHYSLRQARKLICSTIDEVSAPAKNPYSQRLVRSEKAFDIAIAALRVALNNIGLSIEKVEEDWMNYEILLASRNALHREIDVLLKARKALRNDQLEI